MISLLTYNVHAWVDEKKSSNWSRIYEMLKESKYDIITLNEVIHNRSKQQMSKLAQKLGYDYVFQGTKRYPTFGNAILSRNKIISSVTFDLTGDRSATLATIEGYPFDVVVTHLDHVSENTRLIQAELLVHKIKDITDKPYIIMGDFNSYRRTDYTQQEWQHIVEERYQNNWSLPQSKVTKYLDKYLDDTYLLAGPYDNFMTAHTSDKRYRIDYCWLSKDFDYNTIYQKVVQVDYSDHLPVVTVMEL